MTDDESAKFAKPHPVLIDRVGGATALLKPDGPDLLRLAPGEVERSSLIEFDAGRQLFEVRCLHGALRGPLRPPLLRALVRPHYELAAMAGALPLPERLLFPSYGFAAAFEVRWLDRLRAAFGSAAATSREAPRAGLDMLAWAKATYRAEGRRYKLYVTLPKPQTSNPN